MIHIFVTLLCSIILLAFTGFFIFSARFRRDVVAGSGQAQIIGILNVKGASIVVLCGLFLGGTLYSATKSAVAFDALTNIVSVTKVAPEAVELSESVGNDLAALHDSHMVLLEAFINTGRERIESYMVDKWLPAFNAEFFGKVRMDKILKDDGTLSSEALAELTTAQLTEFFLEYKRMTSDLDKRKSELVAELEQAYKETHRKNDAITKHLASLVGIKPTSEVDPELINKINRNLEKLQALESRSHDLKSIERLLQK